MNKIAIAVVALCLSSLVQATPLRLDYAVSDLGAGQYNYDFSLVLDNNDSSWVSGQGWSWFIFGDTADSGTGSPLTDFVMDSSDYPVGPWTGLSASSGGHNGPTFSGVFAKWIPLAVGDTLIWSGTSSADLAQGQLLFSTLLVSPVGTVAADFEVANRLTSVPEPPVMVLLLMGLFVLGCLSSRSGVSSRIVASMGGGITA